MMLRAWRSATDALDRIRHLGIMSKRAPLSVTPANPWVEILRPGTHTSMSGKSVAFTEADVSARVDAITAQLSSGFTPPLVVGHPRHDSPRVGSVVGAKYENGIAYAQVDELTPEFAEACRKGEYKYNSPAFYAEGGLRHLGILGGWNPAMKEQAPIAFGEGMFAEADASSAKSADEVLMFASEADWGSVVGGWLNRLYWRMRSIGAFARSMRDRLIEEKGVEEADKILPSYMVDELNADMNIPYDLNPNKGAQEAVAAPAFGEAEADAPAAGGGNSPAAPADPTPPPPAPAPNAVPQEPEPSARERELQAQLDAANRKLADADSEKAARAFGERLDLALKDGRLSPVVRVRLEKLHGELSSIDLAFAEGESLRQSLVDLVDSLPRVVAFGELPEGKPASTKNPLIADAEARHNTGA